ncbi:aspartate/glutamate racemase family protein [Desulfoluna butyratoxydans]|nr:aspartate/glutamate racemase family protein [Desulfoluna butyratoxydans]
MMILKGGLLHTDTPIGVLCLESYFPKPPGHLRNPVTFDFPVTYKVLRGIDVPTLLFNPTPELVAPFIEAARALEREGAMAITGSCGFLARFQKELTEAVRIPVLVSSLIQIPMVRTLHGPDAVIGVLTASRDALTPMHFAQVGGDINDVVIKGMEGCPEFWETIIEARRTDFDMDRLEAEICGAAEALMAEHNLDALVLECTDLSAFARSIQERIGCPVYDIDGLIEYARYAVKRKVYHGL